MRRTASKQANKQSRQGSSTNNERMMTGEKGLTAAVRASLEEGGCAGYGPLKKRKKLFTCLPLAVTVPPWRHASFFHGFLSLIPSFLDPLALIVAFFSPFPVHLIELPASSLPSVLLSLLWY